MQHEEPDASLNAIEHTPESSFDASPEAATESQWLRRTGGQFNNDETREHRAMTRPGDFTTRPELRGTFGVAGSTHWTATAVAMGVLERGGNAFDAAAAGGFVLQVVEPHLNGPGGEVPILTYSANRDKIEVVCGQGTAPAAASAKGFRDMGLDLVPGTGLLPATVPGAFGAWLRMLADHGSMPLREVLEPAIFYAEQGFPLVPKIVNALRAVEPLFRNDWPSSAEVYLSSNGHPQEGDLFRNPGLAATYRRIVEEAESAGRDRETQLEGARKCWYEGFVAEAIDSFYRTQELKDSTGEHHSGLLTGQDMANWQATVEAPATYDYHGLTVAKCGPWSQGPFMLQQLALLRDLPLGDLPPDGADFIHTVVEAAKLAFADREAWYGDSAGEVPLETLLSDAYNAERRKLMGERASEDFRPGAPDGRRPVLPDYEVAGENSIDVNAMLGVGEPTVSKAGEEETDSTGALRGDTCHIDVIDRWGNMVAATPSGGWFQSSPVVPELGFSLSTRAQMFWLQDGLPSTLAGGKRPRTTLTPSMALKHGKPYLAWGTPGGDQQDQWSLSFLLRHLHHGYNLQEAIDAPSFHSEHPPSSFWPRLAKPNVLLVEGRMPRATVEELKRRGHDVSVGEDWSEGRLSACSQETRNGMRYLRAGANPRGMQGYAAGR
ncbi:gamma-glutamyltransferase family protein [Fodinicurvata sediminis]|uniref:gamma-glutamyltransferase family protein n=1 Tax=Fodinicurvata sediminis TaxID=1121832 RepID=UPI0003B78C62|nr:gamma-glutamyltransferase [Fodinicurvata sediminis]